MLSDNGGYCNVTNDKAGWWQHCDRHQVWGKCTKIVKDENYPGEVSFVWTVFYWLHYF